MRSDLEKHLATIVMRALDVDPELGLATASERVAGIARDQGVGEVASMLPDVIADFSRHAVLNPQAPYLSGARPHFFLLEGRAGSLDRVLADTSRARAGLSQYVLYGDADALVVLFGSTAEADALHDRLIAGAYEEPIRFSAASTPLAYRCVTDASALPEQTDWTVANLLVDDFDSGGLEHQRAQMIQDRSIIGHSWRFKGKVAYPVVAWLGIRLRGRRTALSGSELLSQLYRSELFSTALEHFFEVDGGQPFHFLSKVHCVSLDELDELTNELSIRSFDGIRLDGHTMVVANGIDNLPSVRRVEIDSVSISPDIAALEDLAQSLFPLLDASEQDSFNGATVQRKLASLRAVVGLREGLSQPLGSHTPARVTEAVRMFERQILGADNPALTGPVMETATVVENESRRLLSKLAFSVLGPDQGDHQDVLHLPTRKIKDLSLGKLAQAFGQLAAADQFIEFNEALGEPFAHELKRFASLRNRWAHGIAGGSVVDQIEEAYEAIRSGLALLVSIETTLRLLEESAEPAPSALKVAPPSGAPSVFVSHSSVDSEISERVALGLRAFGYEAWYAEWEIRAGQSIVERISDALASLDVLVVILSKNSVASEWVAREINTALMRQLSGAQVLLIPVLVEDCQRPEILRETKYVDMRRDFEDAFAEMRRSIDEFRGTHTQN